MLISPFYIIYSVYLTDNRLRAFYSTTGIHLHCPVVSFEYPSSIFLASIPFAAVRPFPPAPLYLSTISVDRPLLTSLSSDTSFRYNNNKKKFF